MVSAPRSVSATTTVTEVVKYAPNRAAVHIQNEGPNDISIGVDSSLTFDTGFKISQGQTAVVARDFSDNPTNPIFMVSTSSNSKVNIWEIDKEELIK